MRSPRTVQQMHPLFISNTSSSALTTRASSIPISPNSFSITAMRLPCWAVRMWFSSVVFPDPRKPVRTVTGTLPSRSVALSTTAIPAPFGTGQPRPGDWLPKQW